MNAGWIDILENLIAECPKEMRPVVYPYLERSLSLVEISGLSDSAREMLASVLGMPEQVKVVCVDPNGGWTERVGRLITGCPEDLRADFYSHLAIVLSPDQIAKLSKEARQMLGTILNPSGREETGRAFGLCDLVGVLA